MSKGLRRYEVLLPRRYNDGQPVPDESFTQTLLEIRERFGAVSCETQTIYGYWENEGQSFEDEMARVFIDVADTPDNRQFFEEIKERIKERFRQLEIHVITFPVESV